MGSGDTKQERYIRRFVPNPKRNAFIDLPISHEEYLAARFRSSSGNVGKMKGRVFFKSKFGLFTDEVDLEKTYILPRVNSGERSQRRTSENNSSRNSRNTQINSDGGNEKIYIPIDKIVCENEEPLSLKRFKSDYMNHTPSRSRSFFEILDEEEEKEKQREHEKKMKLLELYEKDPESYMKYIKIEEETEKRKKEADRRFIKRSLIFFGVIVLILIIYFGFFY